MKNKLIKFPFLRILKFLAVISLIILAYQLFKANKAKDNQSQLSLNENYNNWIKMFLEIGQKHGSDKVSTHQYQHLYGFLLGPVRENKLDVLEIGLGCDMNYGPGKSLLLLQEFLPNAKLDYLEFNKTCAMQFKDKMKRIYAGDQSDFGLLKQITDAGKYDLIIDDGGHTRKQQINSFIGLWPSVKPKGGIYVIEDIFTSFLPGYNDYDTHALELVSHLIILMNTDSVSFKRADLDLKLKEISKTLHSVYCFAEVCAIVKK